MLTRWQRCTAYTVLLQTCYNLNLAKLNRVMVAYPSRRGVCAAVYQPACRGQRRATATAKGYTMATKAKASDKATGERTVSLPPGITASDINAALAPTPVQPAPQVVARPVSPVALARRTEHGAHRSYDVPHSPRKWATYAALVLAGGRRGTYVPVLAQRTAGGGAISDRDCLHFGHHGAAASDHTATGRTEPCVRSQPNGGRGWQFTLTLHGERLLAANLPVLAATFPALAAQLPGDLGQLPAPPAPVAPPAAPPASDNPPAKPARKPRKPASK